MGFVEEFKNLFNSYHVLIIVICDLWIDKENVSTLYTWIIISLEFQFFMYNLMKYNYFNIYSEPYRDLMIDIILHYRCKLDFTKATWEK